MEITYSHRYHAGNVGDVWKHTIWLSLLSHAVRATPRLRVLETHAGEGVYKLRPQGEWRDGVGRVRAPSDGHEPLALRRYRTALQKFPDALYPGSPLWTLAVLRPGDVADFYEIDPAAHAALARRVGKDSRAQAHRGDGLSALDGGGQKSAQSWDIVFINPPYTAKEDWVSLPRLVARAHQAQPTATLALWYPIKSYTRPNAMLGSLVAAGVQGVALELVTTPLKLGRNRLNGSGVLVINAPPAAISEALAAAPQIGESCATDDAHWLTRTQKISRKAFLG